MRKGEDHEDKPPPPSTTSAPVPPPPPVHPPPSSSSSSSALAVSSPLLAMEVIAPEELSKATQMFQTLKNLRAKVEMREDPNADKTFQTHISNVLSKLDKRLQTIQDIDLRKIEAMMGKHGIFDATFQQIILITQTIAPDLVGPLKDLRSIHSKFFSELQTSASKVYKSSERARSRYDNETTILQKKYDEKVEDIARLKLTAIALDTEAEDQVRLIEQLREQLQDAYEKINMLGGGAGMTPQQRLKLSKQMSASQSVGQEGTQLSTSQPPNSAFSPNTHSSKNNHSQNSKDGLNGKQIGDDAASILTGTTAQHSYYNGSVTGMLAGITRSKNWVPLFRKAVQKSIDDSRIVTHSASHKSRSLRLSECRDFIARAYESKRKASSMTKDGIPTHPPETMEMHVYKLMEKQYGLRTLAVDNAATLVNSLEILSDEDNDVAVFKCVFGNTIGEDFVAVQTELSRSINDLLSVQIMTKFPNKTHEELKNAYAKKAEEGLNVREWTDIVNYLYNGSDSTVLCSLLQKEAERRYSEPQIQYVNKLDNSSNSPKGNNNIEKKVVKQVTQPPRNRVVSGARSSSSSNSGNKPIRRPDQLLPLDLFRKVVLDFQLKSHIDYLRDVQVTFSQIDVDRDGVVNPSEFLEFFKTLRAKLLLNENEARAARLAYKKAVAHSSSTSPAKKVNRFLKDTEKQKLGIVVPQKPFLSGGGTSKGNHINDLQNSASVMPPGVPKANRRHQAKPDPVIYIAYEYNEFEEELYTSLLEAVDPFHTDLIPFSVAVFGLGKTGAMNVPFRTQ